MTTPTSESIETAARAIAVFDESDWDALLDTDKDDYEILANAILTAAYPPIEAHLMGQAVNALETKLGEMGEPADREEDQFQNGFAAAIAALILRARAATIEGKSE